MHEEWTARRTTGMDSFLCKYKINIVFVAFMCRNNHGSFCFVDYVGQTFFVYINVIDLFESNVFNPFFRVKF